MAPPRWHVGQTAQPPVVPPADVQLTPASQYLVLTVGATAWVVMSGGFLPVGALVLSLDGGPAWSPQVLQLGPPFGLYLGQPVT